MVILKFWFHLSKAGQKRRLKALSSSKKDRWKLGKDDWKHHGAYDRIVKTAEHVIRVTDTAEARWFLIDAEDDRHRELAVLRILVESLEAVVKGAAAPPALAPAPPATQAGRGSDWVVGHDKASGPGRRKVDTLLDHVDLAATVPVKEYRSELAKQQARLWKLTWEANRKKVSSVAVFEGWDAAGKGGCIRRMTWAMDARLYHVISVAKPTDEEYARHYLWRFWRHIPRAGLATIYDRSWYGRVLVERVEGFAKESEWTRAYLEINDFERQLVDHGTVVTKFWLHISPEAQLERFKEREKIAWKKYKLTEEDWRNREKWRAYELSVHDMVVRTSTQEAPWQLVPACDKRLARLTVLRTFCDRLEEKL
jgi:polyphosphate:AMP phosphotransferase